MNCYTNTSLVAQRVKHLPTVRETWVQFLGQEDLLQKEMAIHSSILLGKSHGWRSLVGYSPPGQKESDTPERLHVNTSVAATGTKEGEAISVSWRTCPDVTSFCQASLRHKLPLTKEEGPLQGGLQASPTRLVERTLLAWAVFGDLG